MAHDHGHNATAAAWRKLAAASKPERLAQQRRSVSENAPLEDRFREGKSSRWPRVELERRPMRMGFIRE